MIQDSQCNRVFFSALLRERCPKAFRGLTRVLDMYNVPWSLLEGTKDIWCRDYMPVQVSPNRFAGYTYRPDYLLRYKKYIGTITDGIDVCKKLGYCVDDMFSGIVLDGGNVVKAGDFVIMTGKVLEENPDYSIEPLTNAIESLFDTRLVVVPWDTAEEFGHADGICRYLGQKRILMTNYAQFDARMAARFKRALEKHFDKIEELHFDVPSVHKYSWGYINWLQTEQVLIIPKFGIPEDEQALAQISALTPDYAGRIEQVDAGDLVIHGGCFNCCSWTICDAECDDLPFKMNYDRPLGA